MKYSSHRIPRFLAAFLTCFLLLSTTAQAAAVSDKKTEVSRQTSTTKLSCPKAARTQTKTVSSIQKSISGTHSLNHGLITAPYTGTQKKVVTDSFVKGKTIKTRTTVITTTRNYTLSLSSAVSKRLFRQLDPGIEAAWNKLNYSFVINASETGHVNSHHALLRQIILSTEFTYEELVLMMGFFASYVAGNAAQTAAFQAIYAAEKALFTGYNQPYAGYSAANFFASCFRDFYLKGETLKRTCPRAYAYLSSSIARVTAASASRLPAFRIVGPAGAK